jgi:hypothetical protein
VRSALSLDGVWDAPNTITVRVFDPADVADIPHGKQGGRWYTPVSGPWQPLNRFLSLLADRAAC